MSARARELRRAWRHFWWMVVRRRGYQPTLSRRTYAGIAFRMARCGLFTGGSHAWGPLYHTYEGSPRRKRDCRWCGASLTPASEFEPLTDEDRWKFEGMFRKPTEVDADRALESLRRQGIYRDGTFLWDR